MHLPKEDVVFFSIIMPTFNRGSMIERGIQSVLQQTFQNWELIIIDDGGVDNTKEIVEKFNNPKVRYFWKDNEERSIARNYGIDCARGKYINFLDSDDFHKPDHLQVAYEVISRGVDVPVLHTGYCTFDPETGSEDKVVISDRAHILDGLLKDNLLHGNAIFVKREIYGQVRFLNSRHAVIGEDWYLWLCIAARFQITFVDTVTTCVVNHAGRSIANIDPYKFEKSSEVVIKGLIEDKFLKNKIGEVEFEKFIAYQWLGVGQHFLINKIRSKRSAIKYLNKSLRLSLSMLLTKRFLVCVKKLVLG